MSTCADLRKFAMALEGVAEKPHFGMPSFRTNGKMFAESIPDNNEAILKLSKMHQEILFETRPQTFKPAIWGAIRWARLALDGVAANELKDLVREAYDEVAAKKRSAKQSPAPKRKRARA
ncbi:MAG: MmcQ/YjbR family DNA-binding protein [Alphaproteobacteria bacterium]|nr:MmcQ/YjbR family DNA-binding protein [Alphaproteobacteria bacterium]MBL6938632.1 MmcQ/YjbR family DNA-binding protein [Alphaproteobacteria bacterium]MBL7098011.1 MmcQ/YjbR family DNA-binding protein [Alphaproteobacteria bacterium]